MPTQHDANLTFIISKGFDTSSLSSLKKALVWLRTTDGDNLMYGEGTRAQVTNLIRWWGSA